MNKQILIVGAGVGGLCAAIRLASQGYGITLVERAPQVGGKLNRWVAPHPLRENQHFCFDTGPSLLTLPFVFDELFAAVGERRDQWLPISRLDPIARFVWQDGSQFELRSTSTDVDEQIRSLAPDDVEGWHAFAERGRAIWDLSAELFLYHAPEQVLSGRAKLRGPAEPVGFAELPSSAELAGSADVRGSAGLRNPDGLPSEAVGLAERGRQALSMLTVPLRIGMFSRYAKLVDRHVKSQKLREILYQYATYSGASPFKAPATLAVIPHAEMHFGGWYIPGGMYELALALERLARKLGVRFRTNTTVTEILIDALPGSSSRSGKRAVATGVKLDTGEVLRADAVISNADTVYSYRDLIAARHRPRFPDKKLNALEPGGSGMVLLLGVDGHYPQLAHHTKFMPADYTSDLRAMFETRTVPDDPCIYVCASTRTDPTQAPEGCENLFVLVSAPPLDHVGRAPTARPAIDWSVAGPRYRDRVIHTLEHRFGLTDLSKRIVVERRMTPVDLKAIYNANAGSIYGLGSNSRRTAFLRPPNRDRDVRGLYFTGGATHPGGGLPLVALSGKIVSELVEEDLGGP